MLGLIAALLCVSPHAAVNKTDSGKQTPVKSGKGKTRKATTRNRKIRRCQSLAEKTALRCIVKR